MIDCIVCYMPFSQTHGKQKTCSPECKAQNKKDWFKTEKGKKAIARGWAKYRAKNPGIYAIQKNHNNIDQRIKKLEKDLTDIIYQCDHALG